MAKRADFEVQRGRPFAGAFSHSQRRRRRFDPTIDKITIEMDRIATSFSDG